MKSVTQISHGSESSNGTPVSRSASGKLPRAVSTFALALLIGLTACDNDYTLAYVYAPSASLTAGLINAYGIDNQTGFLRLLNDSPIPSGGRKPTAIAAAPNHQAIYVTNHDDSTVVEFTIGTDGKLYPQNTYNTTGSFPTAVAVSRMANFSTSPTPFRMLTRRRVPPGGITTFPINADNSLGAAIDFSIGRAPIAITVSPRPLAGGQNVVYVAAQDASAINPAASQPTNQTLNLFAFAASTTDGSLSVLPGELIVSGNKASSGYATGTTPGGLIADATATHLYVTDSTGNIVIPYSLGANGVPSLIPIGNTEAGLNTFHNALTGNDPRGLAIDPTGTFLFVANYEGTVFEYTFGSSGEPVNSTTAASTGAGNGTTCVTVEPTHGIYLYASGSLSNTVTGEQILTDGTLKPIINSPFTATTLPLCAVAVARF